MDTLKLGQIIEDEQHRDAVHIAVAPVVASKRLSPGQHIGFDGTAAGPVENPIGIVDPFLSGPVFKGERFWMFLYPGSITSLRHDWTHPAFSTLGVSEAWLRAFASTAGLSYEELLKGAEDYLISGECLCQGSRWDGFDMPDELWDHYGVVKQVTVPSNQRGYFFSCAC